MLGLIAAAKTPSGNGLGPQVLLYGTNDPDAGQFPGALVHILCWPIGS